MTRLLLSMICLILLSISRTISNFALMPASSMQPRFKTSAEIRNRWASVYDQVASTWNDTVVITQIKYETSPGKQLGAQLPFLPEVGGVRIPSMKELLGNLAIEDLLDLLAKPVQGLLAEHHFIEEEPNGQLAEAYRWFATIFHEAYNNMMSHGNNYHPQLSLTIWWHVSEDIAFLAFEDQHFLRSDLKSGEEELEYDATATLLKIEAGRDLMLQNYIVAQDDAEFTHSGNGLLFLKLYLGGEEYFFSETIRRPTGEKIGTRLVLIFLKPPSALTVEPNQFSSVSQSI